MSSPYCILGSYYNEESTSGSSSTKGQLISKRLFGKYLQFSQKTNKKNLTLLLRYLKSNCFHSFFGRIEDTKKTFRN